MHKRILLIIVTLFCCNTFLSVFSSCNRKPSSGVNYKDASMCTTPACFMFKTASVSIFDAVTHKQLAAPAYPVKATDLELLVLLEGNTAVCKAPERQRSLSLFSTAYAYAAPQPCFIKQGGDSVLSYNIYSNKDYDQVHPAGTSLNDIITTDDIPTHPFYSQYTSKAVIALDLMVNALPADTGRHIFTIVLNHQNGKTTTVMTPSIKLLK